MVGDAQSIKLPDWGRLRAGRGRLRGLRCLHTHLADEGLSQDDRSDLLLLRLDAMVTIGAGEDGLPTLAHTAALTPATATGDGVELLEPRPPSQLDIDFELWIRDREEALARATRAREVGGREKAILVSVTAGRNATALEIHVEELRELARSAGVEIVDVVTQHRSRVDPKTVVGSGKHRHCEADILDMAHHRPLNMLDESVPTVVGRIERYAPGCWPQAGQVVERTRDTDRTTMICAKREGSHGRGHGRARSSTGSPCRHVHVPRISGCAEDFVGGVDIVGKFGCVGLP